MPLQIVPLDPKENEHIVKRASHCPLRFTAWASTTSTQAIHFRHSPFAEETLQHIAADTPSLPHLELLVFERSGTAIGYLGHPDEYLAHSWKTPAPRFRAKVVSESGRFIEHLQRVLLPHVLQEALVRIGQRLRLTRKAVDELHRREEEHVRAAHLLMPVCTTLEEVKPGQLIRRAR